MIDVTAAMQSTSFAAPPEPQLDIGEIQGNVMPGFRKPRMAVLAFRLGTDVAVTRRWITALIPKVTTLAGTLDTLLKVREARLQLGVTAGFTDIVDELDDCWMNIAFSYRGLAKLLKSGPHHPARFADEAFKTGAAGRSSMLGDPTDRSAPGNPANWKFGGPDKEADVLVVVGADKEPTMTAYLTEFVTTAEAAGVTLLWQDTGGKLDAIGSEHFGFQDGVSEPGVRGRIGDNPDVFLTPRTISPNAQPEALLYGLPGQHLVWPGAFVFGYPTPGADPLIAAPPQVPGPAWSRNGSYLVYRRLRQDVAGFRAFAEQQAAELVKQGFDDMTSELLQALLIGRWPSGAPLSRSPKKDDPELGKDPTSNNDFGFVADTPKLPLIKDDAPRDYPLAKADPIGLTCPLVAHIRKVNTRDESSDQGGKRSSLQRRLLRRGLPYGPQLADGSGEDNTDRGLMFVCYQASIVDQFEFLCSSWMADPVAPRSPSGHDMVVGQNGQPGDGRERSCVLLLGNPPKPGTVTTMQDFVVPTAAGYFFTPSISALRDVIGKPDKKDQESET